MAPPPPPATATMAAATDHDDPHDERSSALSSTRLLVATPSHAQRSSVVVVGLGLIGSAAIRYLSAAFGSSVLAIGPPEPSVSWETYSGPFSSHYDQGRLARIADPDPVWAALAARSMARYRALEQASGIRFHEPVGSIRVSPLHDNSLYRSFEVARRHGAEQELFEFHDMLQDRFPCFQFQTGDAAIMERGEAGFINPRNLVAAQLAMAEKNGARIVRESVTEIVPMGSGVCISTDKGRSVLARKVLVCAGSYSKFLLPGDAKHLDMTTHARTVLLAEVDAREAVRLRDMPTFIWHLPKNPYLNWVYGCPPVEYPDGRVAMKVGGTAWKAADVGNSVEDLSAWFKSGGDEVEQKVLEEVLLQQLMPGLRTLSLSRKPCVVSFTAHGRPYIDAVDGDRCLSTARVFVATGGCGAAAKSSDEIGRLAALMVVHGRWPSSDMDSSAFRAVYARKGKTQSSFSSP